jgi:hypothetical protein
MAGIGSQRVEGSQGCFEQFKNYQICITFTHQASPDMEAVKVFPKKVAKKSRKEDIH